MRLHELESAVHAHMLKGGTLPEALVAAVAAPAAERWEIYTDGYRSRLIEALSLQYPALHSRLGTDEFTVRAEAFVEAVPSVHRSVRDYGRELGEFIRAHSDELDDRMLGELADFEWQLADAFDAANAVPTQPADLATIPPGEWADLRFAAVPSVRRLATRTNAVAAWRAAQNHDSGATAPAAAETEPTEWLIWRRGLATEFRSAATPEAQAFDALVGGATFGQLCEALASADDADAGLHAASWLKGWLLGGLLLRV